MPKYIGWIFLLFFCFSFPVQAQVTSTLTILDSGDIAKGKQFIATTKQYTLQLTHIDEETFKTLKLEHYLTYSIADVVYSTWKYDKYTQVAHIDIWVAPKLEYANKSSELYFWVTLPKVVQSTPLYISLGSRITQTSPKLLQLTAPNTFLDDGDLKIYAEFDSVITSMPLITTQLKIKCFNAKYSTYTLVTQGNILIITLKDVFVEIPQNKSTLIVSINGTHTQIACKSTMLDKRAYIENTYGIHIALQSLPNTLTSTNKPLMEIDRINTMLSVITQELERYPKAFIQELLQSVGYLQLSFAQSNQINDGLTGLTTLKGQKIVFMVLYDNPYVITSTFHHEMFHVIEYALYFKYPNKEFGSSYALWHTFNPKAFKYTASQTPSKQYTLLSFDTLASTYFINAYSKTSPYEDRATLFSELMVNTYPTSYYNLKSDLPLALKIAYLVEVLDLNFTSLQATQNIAWKENIS